MTQSRGPASMVTGDSLQTTSTSDDSAVAEVDVGADDNDRSARTTTERVTRPRAVLDRSISIVRRIHPAWVLEALALLPVYVIVQLVLQSSNLQWFDYWTALPRYISANGSLIESGLFGFHEGHVIAVAGLIQWTNFQLTGGLNRTLGLFVIAAAAAQLVVLRSLLPRASVIGRWWFSGLVVALAALLFAPQGAHNFSRAASGSAWLTANLFVVVAIALVYRRRTLTAIPFGVLATMTYGTGLGVWPALLVVSAARTRWSRRHSVLAVAGVVAAGAYALLYDRPASQSAFEFAPNETFRRIAQVIGSALVPNPDMAVVLGVIGLVAAGCLAVLAARKERVIAAPWIGLAVYAVIASVLIGIVRGGINPADIGVASRYFSMSALCWSSVVVLAMIVWKPSVRTGIGVVLVGALAFVGGQAALTEVRASIANQNELAIAMRLGLSEGYPFFWGAEQNIDFFRTIGHYPFTDDFDADCGMAGEFVDGNRIREVEIAGAETRGFVDGFLSSYNERSVRIGGWFGSTEGSVRCILVTNQSLEVIGAGAYGIERPDLVMAGGVPGGNYDAGFVGVAADGAEQYRVFALLDGDSTAYEINGEELDDSSSDAGDEPDDG